MNEQTTHDLLTELWYYTRTSDLVEHNDHTDRATNVKRLKSELRGRGLKSLPFTCNKSRIVMGEKMPDTVLATVNTYR